MSHQENIATDDRAWMTQHEAEYLRAVEYRKSPQRQENELKALVKIRAALFGKIEQPWEAVGRIKQIIADTYEYEWVITEYESRKRSVGLMYPKPK